MEEFESQKLLMYINGEAFIVVMVMKSYVSGELSTV